MALLQKGSEQYLYFLTSNTTKLPLPLISVMHLVKDT